MSPGDWIAPRRGQELFEVWAPLWMETLASRKPKTRETDESIVHRHLLPRVAATPIAAIDYPCVLAFVAGLRREVSAPASAFATCCASCSFSPSDRESSR